jgi:hypothetical protein
MEEFKSARFVHVLPPWFGGEEHHQRRKFETIKWMFGMFLMATVAIIGTILTVLKMGGW